MINIFGIQIPLLLSLLCSSVVCDVSPYLKFTGSGEIAQVEYAQKAIGQSRPCVAFRSETFDAVFLVCFESPPSPLAELGHSARIFSDSAAGLIGLFSGYPADVGSTVNFVNKVIQEEYFIFGEPPNLHKLSGSIAKHLTEGLYIEVGEDGKTKPPLRRPLAVATILAAWDDDLQRTRLFQVDNTGRITERNVCLLGQIAPLTKRKILQQQAAYDAEQKSLAERGGDEVVKHCKENLVGVVKECVDVILQQESDHLWMQCALLNRDGRIHKLLRISNSDDVCAWLRSAMNSIDTETNQ